ncbi:MAG: hypothetical protein WD875_14655 [Pirellulales bacterium]
MSLVVFEGVEWEERCGRGPDGSSEAATLILAPQRRHSRTCSTATSSTLYRAPQLGQTAIDGMKLAPVNDQLVEKGV